MNHCYRLIWSCLQNAWVAVAETARARGKSKTSVVGSILTISALSFSAPTFAAPPAVDALPTGGSVAAGQASISAAGNVMNVNQATQRAILNWQSFDIGAQSTVNFIQPNSGAVALNRVLGNDASQIFGHLSANGNVFLLNPQGTYFAPGSQVNVGGLLASTLHMGDIDFMNGNDQLSNPGVGLIEALGNIKASNGVALVANDVKNGGNIFAANVSLVAGNTVAIDLSGDGLIRARVQDPALRASISNSGNIQAATVAMTAGQTRDTLNSVVNNTGVIRATGISNEGGLITLQGGTTLNSGKLDASSSTGKGGTVTMLGEHVGVTDFGSINASGATGGGSILVGGDFQGKNPNIQNANRTYFGANASLNADATNTGDGGKVIVWANDTTRGYGQISARGGKLAGSGGFVEVSGKHSLDYRALTDTSAAQGQFGTLLLDPDNIIIDAIGGDPLPPLGIFFGDPGSVVTLFNGLINNASTNVVLQANGNINFIAPINMTTANAGLTVQAGQIINVNSSITTNGGIVDLTAGALPNPFGGGPFGVLKINAAIDTTNGGTGNGANVLLTNVNSGGGAAGGVQINGNISAGAGTVFINNTGDAIVQNAANSISANDLQVKSGRAVSLTGANQITGSLAANITGAGASFIYNSGSPVNVGTVGAVNGISTNNGDVTLTSVGDLNTNQVINAGTGGNMALTAQFGNVNVLNDLRANNINATSQSGSIAIGNAFSSPAIQPTISASNNIGLLAQQDSLGGGGNIDILANISHTDTVTGAFVANADNNIVLHGGTTITSPNGAFNITLASDFDVANGGTIRLDNDAVTGGVSVNSNGGNITLGGGAGAAGFAIAPFLGAAIRLDAATLDAGGGNIALRGEAPSSDGSVGIYAADSSIKTTTAGSVDITGNMTGNGGSGTQLLGATIQAQNGDINITGDASTASASANGILLDSSLANKATSISSNGAGNINLTGRRAGAIDGVAGITVAGATVIQNALTGNVSLTGTSTGDVAGIGQRGILVSGAGTIISTADGDIALNGDASAGDAAGLSDGILMNGGAIVQSTGNGQVNLTGISALTGTAQSGIAIADPGTKIQALGNGSISIGGISNGLGTNSFGVVLFNGSAIAANGTGIIDIFAKANNTTSAGLAVDGASVISTNSIIIIRAGNNDTSPAGDQIRFDSAGGAQIIGATSTPTSLRINPIDPSVGIALGDNSNTLGAFSLNSADLAAIGNFNEVSIGNASHTGTFNVAAGGLNSFSAANNNSAVYLSSATANMDFFGASTFSSALSVTNNAGDISLSSLTSTNGTIGVLANDNLSIKAGSVIQSVFITNLIANADFDTGGTGGGNFINLAGSGALASSASSKWHVYSFDVAGDNRGGLVYDFKQYNANYLDPVVGIGTGLGHGNGFIYADAPVISASLTGPITKTYNGDNLATVTAANFTSTGAIDGDSVTINNTGATYADKNAGSAKSVTASGLSLAATNGAATVYGYQFAPTTLSANVGTIRQANLTLNASSVTKTYDGTTSAAGAVGIVGLVAGDSVSASQSFASKNVLGTNGSTLNVNAGYIVNDGNSGNNYLVTSTSAAGTITPLAITGNITANNKTYDATTVASIASRSLTGVLGTDVVSYTGGSATFVDKNAALGKTVTATGLSIGGTDAGNYTVNSSVTTNANIAKAPLTLTAPNISKLFDGTNAYTTQPADLTTFSASLLGTDSVTAASFSFDTPAVGTNKNVAFNAVTINDGNGGANYLPTLLGNSNGIITGTSAPIPVPIPVLVDQFVSNSSESVTNSSLAADITICNGTLSSSCIENIDAIFGLATIKEIELPEPSNKGKELTCK